MSEQGKISKTPRNKFSTTNNKAVVQKSVASRKPTNSIKRAEIMNLIAGMVSRRDIAQMMGTQFDGNRDLYAVLGYKRQVEFDHYLAAYERQDIAQRIVDAPAQATWRRKPVISDDSDPENFTEFEKAWTGLTHKRRVFHYLERADRLSGIGEYGALLIGTDDVRKQEDFVRPLSRLRNGTDSILYLTPFMQNSATVAEIEGDPQSDRYGLPKIYNVALAGASINDVTTSKGLAALNPNTVPIHWSRMIHIAEGLRENDIIGQPRLKPVFNRLYDIEKISGGSAEIFWQAAKRIMVLQAKDNFTAVDTNDALTTMMDELIHGLRRVIDIQGYEVKTLETSDVRPDEAFRVALALVSSATGIPQRILLGSEQGKMASTQDEVNWNGRIADRQINFAEPVILRQFVDRLIAVSALPRPQSDYVITWPSLFELSDKEKAQIGLLKSRSLAQYIGRGGENLEIAKQVIPMEEFRGELLNLRAQKIETAIKTGGGQADNPSNVSVPADTTEE